MTDSLAVIAIEARNAYLEKHPGAAVPAMRAALDAALEAGAGGAVDAQPHSDMVATVTGLSALATERVTRLAAAPKANDSEASRLCGAIVRASTETEEIAACKALAKWMNDDLTRALDAGFQVEPIERDEGMDRTYIPLPGGWEVQAKGKGSTFRLCDPKGDRTPVTCKFLQDDLVRMAHDIRAAFTGEPKT